MYELSPLEFTAPKKGHLPTFLGQTPYFHSQNNKPRHPSIHSAEHMSTSGSTAPAGGHLVVQRMPALSKFCGKHSASSSVFSCTLFMCCHLMW